MKTKAFVIMPFAPDFDEIYNLFIADALTESGFEVFRADDIRRQQNILQDIVSAISTSNLIVADLTDSNPNVYYELGIAHALRKQVILLTQNLEELPFDLRSYRVINYDTHFAAIKNARNELILLAKGALNGTVPFGSPVIDFIGSSSNKPLAIEVTESKEESVEADLGFLDHIVRLEEGFAEITTIVTEIAEETHLVTEHITTFTKQMGSATKNGGAGTARSIKNMAGDLAIKLDEYKANVENANTRYINALNKIGNSLEYIVTAQDIGLPRTQEQLSTFIDQLAMVEDGALKGRDNFSGMAETMEKSPKIEKRLNRAIQNAAKEIRIFAGNVDQTVAMVSRARNVGERILRKYEPITKENINDIA